MPRRAPLSVLCLLLACSETPDTGLSIQFSSSATSYGLRISDGAGAVTELCCPDRGNGVSCDEDGFVLPSDTRFPVQVRLKARGFSFLDTRLDAETADGQTLALQPLSGFEETGDYTNFIAKDDLETFEKYASQSGGELGHAWSMKFQVLGLQTGTPKVYFQNTLLHPLHYPFAHDILHVDLDQYEYWKQAYQGEDRDLAVGTLTWYPDLELVTDGGGVSAPFVLSFFPRDNIQPALITRVYRLLEERLGPANVCSGENAFYYLPIGSDQEAEAGESAGLLADNGVAWLKATDLYAGITFQVMNPGLFYGVLRVLEDAPGTEPYSFKDILVMKDAPIQIPLVGGTITEAFQTALSHVNVAAKARGTPNLVLPGALSRKDVTDLVGRWVRFEAKTGQWSLTESTQADAEAFYKTLHKAAKIPAADLAENRLKLLSEIVFADSKAYGRKTSNLGELRRLLPDNSPVGFGVPFYYYQQFMDAAGSVTAETCAAAEADCLKEGREAQLCGQVKSFCAALAPASFQGYVDAMLEDAGFQKDTTLREAVLDTLRFLMRNTPVSADFAAALQEKAQEVFGDTRLRLRSSTNSEDLEGFSGAGLYSSTGAYASGDLEPAAQEIRKVFASLWNFRAFEERAFWNIDHRKVRMAVAVSTAYQDEDANGVVLTRNPMDPTLDGMYVNVQPGETPVTNPEGSALPEVFLIIPAPDGGVQVQRRSFSSLSPLEPVMSDPEIVDLYLKASMVHGRFAKLYSKEPANLVMDVEFKLVPPTRHLVIKQARPY